MMSVSDGNCHWLQFLLSKTCVLTSHSNEQCRIFAFGGFDAMPLRHLFFCRFDPTSRKVPRGYLLCSFHLLSAEGASAPASDYQPDLGDLAFAPSFVALSYEHECDFVRDYNRLFD